MLHLSSLVVLAIFLLLPTTAFAQPPEVAPADQKRIEELERDGRHVTGDHVEMWFPMTVSRSDAESLRDRLDRAIGEARQMIGTQPWQRLGAQRIAYYFPDGDFGGHGTGLGKVFVPTASLQQAEGTSVVFGVAELLVPVPYLLEGKVEGNVFAPDLVLSVLLGLRHYIRLTAGERTGFVETGQYDLGRLRDIDTLCVTRVRATEPSMYSLMLALPAARHGVRLSPNTSPRSWHALRHLRSS